MAAQVPFKCLARVLASQITVKNNSLCIFDIQAGTLYRLNCQLRRHGYAIGIPDNLAAAQVHHGSQISPSLFLHMDVGNISTPFLMDGFCLKITFQEIYFIIWDGSVVCMVVIFFTTTDLSPCLAICLWTRFTLYGVPLSLRVRQILTAPYLCLESS